MKTNKDDYCHECGDKLLRSGPVEQTKDGHGWCKHCQHDSGLPWINLAESRCHHWLNVGADDYRLHFGEMSAQEIRTVRAVLAHILEIPVP